MRHGRSLLGWKVVRVVLPAMVLLTLAATALIGRHHAKTLAEETHRAQEETSSLFADLAAEPLWKLDRPAMQALCERLVVMSAVRWAEVVDESGQTMIRVASNKPAQGGAQPSQLVKKVFYEAPQASRREIGAVRLAFDDPDNGQRAGGGFWWEFGLVMFTMLSMAAIFGVLFARDILGPLGKLSAAIRRSERDQAFVEAQPGANDEIGEVIDAYNSMQRNLAQRTQSLREVYDLTPALLFSLDASARFLSVSDFFCQSVQYTREALLAQPFFMLTGQLQPVTQQMVVESLRRGQSIHGLQLPIVRRDGQAMEVLLNTFVQEAPGEHSGSSLCVMTDISKQVEAQAVISKQANFDEVTGLPNRHMLRDQLVATLSNAARTDTKAAVLFLDLDRFKTVNDTLGHRAGDALLVEVSQRLLSVLRGSDTVGRFGGDEYVIVIKGVESRETVGLTAERLLKRIAEPYVLQGQQVFISASVGVAMFPEDGRDPEALLMNADTAMYRAKRMGRNAARFFQVEMNDQLRLDRDMERCVRDALQKGHLLLHMQPIVDLDSAERVGFEALVRIRNVTGGPDIQPDQFIGLAEDIGLIRDIGQWVLNRSLALLQRWPVHEGGPRYLALNVSPKQLARVGYLDELRAALEASQVDPNRLVLEITESCLFDEEGGSAAMIELLEQIRALGCSIALDDFGTGHSSLSMLRQLPIDILKIDRSFIRGVPTHTKNTELVRTVLAIARQLSLKVVAEGVEEADQARFLAEQGAGLMAQGFYFAAPGGVGQWFNGTLPGASEAMLEAP